MSFFSTLLDAIHRVTAMRLNNALREAAATNAQNAQRATESLQRLNETISDYRPPMRRSGDLVDHGQRRKTGPAQTR